MNSKSFQKKVIDKLFVYKSLINIYLQDLELALNNTQALICYERKNKKKTPNQIYTSVTW